jgi:hypothetical protein
MSARSDAKARGLKTYMSDRPCKSGHLAPRAVLTGTCTECTRLATQAWFKRNPEKGASYTAAYRARNRELVLEKDRELKRRIRAKAPERHRQVGAKAYRKRVLETEGREVTSFNRLPLAKALQRLAATHQGRIEYVADYSGVAEPARFRCTMHDTVFSALPHNVLRGANPCTRCNHMKSQGEDEIFRFLQIFCNAEQRNRTVLKPRELDIYAPPIAVEYCGEYYHSLWGRGGDTQKHYTKYQQCKDKGLRLLTIYESEWKTRKPVIKRLLRNAVGAAKGSVMARRCELRHVPFDEAQSFFEAYHPQGGRGNGEHYGLYWNGRLVACMRFSFGVNDRGRSERAWTLSRYATRIRVVGGASRLWAAFLREHQPTLVKSFSDNRYFEGGMYEKLGFRLDEELAPDYMIYQPKLGLLPKSAFQRRNIPKRLQELGIADSYDPATDPRSERDMLGIMRAGRLYDCGKKRWVWGVDTPSAT